MIKFIKIRINLYKKRIYLKRQIAIVIFVFFILNSISLINGVNYIKEKQKIERLNPDSPQSLQIITPIPITYKIKISENPLELGKTVEIVVDVSKDLGIIQVLIEYEGLNHSMKEISTNIWIWDDWTPSTVGSYPFTVYLQNKSGYWYYFSEVLKVVLDTTPPEFNAIIDDVSEVKPGQTLKISINIMDLHGLKQVLLEFQNVNYSMENLPGTNIWQYELTVPDSEGQYYYKIYMEDNYNNWNFSTGAIQVANPIDQDDNISPFPWVILIGVFIIGLILGVITTSKLKTFDRSRNRELKQIVRPIGNKDPNNFNPLLVECPKCKATNEIFIPKSLFDDFKGILSIIVPKNLVCEHPFQIFLDHFCEIRGYQSIDYEIE